MEIARRAPFGANPTVGERGAETQQRILDAGLSVFADLGFDAARVELITEQAGCSRPAFYQYFSSKDDVFWKLAGRLGRDMVALGDRLPAVSFDAAGLAAFAAWLDEFAAMHETYSAVFSSFQAASREQPQTSRSSVSISEQLARGLLRAFGNATPDHAALLLGEGVVAVIIRCCFYGEEMGEVAARESFLPAVAQFVHRLFAGPRDGVNVDRGARGAKLDVPEVPHVEVERPDEGAVRPRGEKTRRKLLDAGAKVLPSLGYQATRVDDVVAAAGVSHGSFYRYFPSKDEFFRTLADDAATRMVELLDAFPIEGNAADMRRWVDQWFTTYEGNGGVISVWQEMQASDGALAGFSLQVAFAVIGRLGRILQSRGFGDASLDALVFLAVTERLPYSVFTLQFAERDDAIDAMVTIIRRGFLGLAA